MIERMKECPSYSKMRPDDGVSYERLVEAKEVTVEEARSECERQGLHALCTRNLDDETKCKILRFMKDCDWEQIIVEEAPEIFFII